MEKPRLSSTLQLLELRSFKQISFWWRNLSFFQKVWPALFVSSYWMILQLIGGFRGDHIFAGCVLLLLSYSGPVGRVFLKFGLPFILTALVYDSQRFYGESIRGTIHILEPYLFDRYFFGIQSNHQVLTPNEWWQLHTHPVLDFIAGIAYLVFFILFICIAIYFTFFLGRRGNQRMSGPQIQEVAFKMPWAFFFLNMLGYSTYYWYAAAPPWYVAKYGFGPVLSNAPSDMAGCIRFDQLMGVQIFKSMYCRAADVFGAIPSLHVSYPLLAVIFAFYFGSARLFCISFYIVMCFAAVYLNHHYILDIIWGSAYALAIGWITLRWHSLRNFGANGPKS